MEKENARNSEGKQKILAVLGGVAPRELAENELDCSLNVGEENARNSEGK